MALSAGMMTAVAPAGASSAPSTTRVSVASDGTEGNAISWLHSSISGDGRYVAFISQSSNLVAGDLNNATDVFVHDRATRQTTLVSKASDGTQGNNGSDKPAISADGRYVAFITSATNFGETPLEAGSLYVHDRQTGATTLVSKASDGTPGHGDEPAISADGRHVAFMSNGFGRSLLPGSNRRDDVYVHDRDTGTTTRVSVGTGGVDPNSYSVDPTLSADGRYVAFWSNASNLVAGDTNAQNDVFVHDRTAGTTTRLSVASDGTEANGANGEPRISADGRYVAFHSGASNLVPGDTNGTFDIFVHDRESATTSRVSVASGGSEANHFSFAPAISTNGRYVAFESRATNLAAGDENNSRDVYLHDRVTGATIPISVAMDGTVAPGEDPSISADGRYIVFWSDGDTLVPGDTNGTEDFFVRETRGAPIAAVGDVAVHEGDGGTRTAVFTVTLSEPSASPVTVAYATADGTASSADYAATAGTATFAPGATSVTLKVPVVGDVADEPDEVLGLALSSPSGATLGDAIGEGTIYDDDPRPVTGRRLAIGDVAVHEGHEGGRAAVFTVSLSKASTSYVSVKFATAKGTANGTDFTGKSGTLSLAPGTTQMKVKVPITPDASDESDETFAVNLSGATGATITDALGAGTIIDDD